MVGLFPVLSSNGDLCSGFVVQDLWYMPNVANAVAFSWVVVPALADTVILPWFDAMASFTRVWSDGIVYASLDAMASFTRVWRS
jgi:hypothetical protein